MSARTVALQRFLLDMEARALKAEAVAAQWEARWELAFRELQLKDATLHELVNRHRVAIVSLTCQDCGWAGRTNPYFQAEGG